jgi:hypothetical protein
MIKTNKILWSEQFKIRLAKADVSMDLHDIIKILAVRKIIRNCKNKSWLRVYTEFAIGENEELIPDIYVENLQDKSIICYEIQKQYDEKYVLEKTKQYSEVNVPFFNSIDFIIIPLRDCPKEIKDIDDWLSIFIV